jgi:hypothetical protein
MVERLSARTKGWLITLFAPDLLRSEVFPLSCLSFFSAYSHLNSLLPLPYTEDPQPKAQETRYC